MRKLRRRAYARQFGFKYRRDADGIIFCMNKSEGFGFSMIQKYSDEEFIAYFDKCLELMEEINNGNE